MSKVEKKISITYAILCVAIFAVNFIYNFLVDDNPAPGLAIAVVSMLESMIYLFFIFIFTRKHSGLAFLVVLALFTTLMLIALYVIITPNSSISASAYSWKRLIYDVLIALYYCVSFVFAIKDAKKLRIEDLNSKLGTGKIQMSFYHESNDGDYVEEDTPEEDEALFNCIEDNQDCEY